MQISIIKERLQAQFKQREQWYYIIRDIFEKLSQDHLPGQPSTKDTVDNSEVFGLNKESLTYLRPVLVRDDIPINLSMNQERTLHNAMKEFFYVDEALEYKIKTIRQQNNQQYDSQHYIKDLNYDHYYNYPESSQFVSEQIILPQLLGMESALHYFEAIHDNSIPIIEKMQSSYQNSWIKYLNNLNTSSTDALKYLEHVKNINGTTNKLQVKDSYIPLLTQLHRVFYPQEHIATNLMVAGLQLFRTEECKRIQNNKFGAFKRYEHVCFEKKPSKSDAKPSEFIEPYNMFLQEYTQKELQDVEQKFKDAYESFTSPVYTICCPGCCIPDDRIQFDEKHRYNAQHGRSCMSGKVVTFTATIPANIKKSLGNGFFMINAKYNTKQISGLITIEEKLKGWHETVQSIGEHSKTI